MSHLSRPFHLSFSSHLSRFWWDIRDKWEKLDKRDGTGQWDRMENAYEKKSKD